MINNHSGDPRWREKPEEKKIVNILKFHNHYQSRVLQKSIGGVKTGSVACHTRNGFSTPYKVIPY